MKLLIDECLSPDLTQLASDSGIDYQSVEEATRAFRSWQRSLEKSLDESLGELSKRSLMRYPKTIDFVRST